LKGCLAWIGGAVVVLFIIGACATGMKPSTGLDSALKSSTANTSDEGASTNSECNSAISHSNQAFKDFQTGDYSGGYKNATTAVHLADSCSDTDMPSVKGFALSAKAFNEHHLSAGDSVTDINQATQLLADCQTQPGYYGTHLGALCETQEENDISTKTNWDMANY
jgi:hypothetical protein